MGKFALQSEYCRSTAFRQKISITVGMLSYRPTSTCPYIELLYPLKQVIINPIYFVLSPKTDSILATHVLSPKTHCILATHVLSPKTHCILPLITLLSPARRPSISHLNYPSSLPPKVVISYNQDNSIVDCFYCVFSSNSH